MKLKALTINEPWASLIVSGEKTIETRPYATSFRGKIAIHAAKSSRFVDRPQDFNAIPAFLKLIHYQIKRGKIQSEFMADSLDLGCIIATADLVDCRKIIGTRDEPVTLAATRETIMVANSKIILEGNPYNMEIDGTREYDLGDYTPGHYAWIFKNIHRIIQPIPVKGHPQLWNFEMREGNL